MSKAAEYAKAVQDRPEFMLDGLVVATVAGDGWMAFGARPPDLTPRDALRLAEWINETFGEDGE